MLGGATEQGLSQWLPAYTERDLGFSKEVGGLALAGFSVAMALGRMAVAMLQSRLKPIPTMMGCCVAAIALFIIVSFPPGPAIALAACVATGFVGSCLWPTMLAVSADAFPYGGATMFGLLTAFGNAGCGLVPWLVGIIAEHSSLSIGLVSVVACPAGMLLILLWMSRQTIGRSGHLQPQNVNS